MDTSELIEKLHRRLEETVRDRDNLIDAVAELNKAIAQLDEEEQTVTRLARQFSDESPTAEPDQKKVHDNSPTHEANLTWPMGPGFEKPIKTKKVKSWARYKFAAADWYLETLGEITSRAENQTRTLGVEMAVDGVIHSLGAAYDAAVYALTRAVERAVKVPKNRRTPVSLASWSKIAAEAKFFAVDLASTLSISDALIGEHTEDPEGWLAQLLVLRRRLELQDVLVDSVREETGTKELLIDVPGRGLQPLMTYLTETRNLIGELLETLMHDVSDAKNGRLYLTDVDQLRAHAERDLSSLLTLDRLADS